VRMAELEVFLPSAVIPETSDPRPETHSGITCPTNIHVNRAGNSTIDG